MGQSLIYSHLRRILPGLNKPVVLELGAHIGTDTVKLMSLLDEPFYLAVEPDYRNVTELEKLKKQVGLDFIIVDRAISIRAGEWKLHLSDGITKEGRRYTDGSSILRPTIEALRTGYTWKETVPVRCVTLDDLYHEYHLSRIDFIWSDIQGAELEMIIGGQVALLKTHYLYTECMDGRILYEGQPSLAQMITALPGKWKIIFKTSTDVFLENSQWA